MTPLNIDDLLRETEATSFTLPPTTAEETQDLDVDLSSLVAFQHECERRLNDLTFGRGTDSVTVGREGEDRAGDAARPCDVMQRLGRDGCRPGGGDEAEERKEARADGMAYKEDEEGGCYEIRVNGAMEQEGKGKKVGRRTDCEGEMKKEELEEEEGMKLAQKSLQEAVSDLTTLQQPSSAGRSVKPKSKLCPRRSSDYQHSSASDHFGGGQRVVQRPRPQVNSSNAPNSTIDDLEREMANLLDAFLQDSKKRESGHGVHSGKITTTTPTTITTTSVTTAAANTSPPPPPPPRDTPRTTIHYSTTTPTTPTTPPLSVASIEDFAITYPTYPISSSVSSLPLTSPSPQGDEKKDQQTFFSGLKNLGWRNSLKKKKRKKTDLVIGHPKDFRMLTATTSIKPDADPFIRTTAAWRGTNSGTKGQGTEQRYREWNK